MQQARKWLRDAASVVVLTGAGISAESGVPTFRGPGGLWRNYRPEDLATPEAFARDPELVWQWYDWRRALIRRAQPNEGHRALAELERRKEKFLLVTQNVDGLHERAGSRRVVKLHGDIWRVRCTACGAADRDERAPLPQLPPRCRCGGLLRPDVVWFGEPLPDSAWRQAEAAARSAELMLVVGTSALVYPAAELAPLARGAGARLIEVNLEETPLSALSDCSLRGKAAELLPRLLE
ncbi:MAG: NAD-dependent deacylase [Bryobacterales bacterium]|nr:NAD-dependent deacylase [Bryobacteraceae bacterium]MDW8353348.1 NAD-dependent deacylase [Bryobacterales bacterium]